MIEEIKKYFKLSHKKPEFKKERIYRKPDIIKIWNLVVVLGIVAVALSVLWHTYRFYKLSNKDFTKTYIENMSGNEKINENKLNQVIGKFDARNAKFEEISATDPLVVDPSL